MAGVDVRAKLKNFALAGNTFARRISAPDDVNIDVEIGDSKQPDYKPQVKISHWENECNFSLRAEEHPAARVVVENDIAKYKIPGGQEVWQYEKPDRDENGGFELELRLPKRPLSNRFTFTIETKGLVFTKQNPLTQAQIDRGDSRPDDVVGSYAAYHFARRGGRKYKNGKAFHLYRPKAHDADGSDVWCDLDINVAAKTLRVTVPQAFLDNAAYPVVVDPTFGYTSIGGSTSNIAQNHPGSSQDKSLRIGNEYTPSEAGTLDSLHVALSASHTGNAANSTLLLELWVKDGNGADSHDRLAQLENTSNSPTTTPAWYSISASSEAFSAVALLITAASDDSDVGGIVDIRFHYDSSGSDEFFYEDYGKNGYNTLKADDPWGRAPDGTGRVYSAYATYTASGGGVPGAMSIVTARKITAKAITAQAITARKMGEG